MLRLLTVSGLLTLVVSASIAHSSEDPLIEASRSQEETSALAQDAFADVEDVDAAASLPDFDDAARRAEGLPIDALPNLSEELTDPKTLRAVGEIMANVETMAAELGMSDTTEFTQIYVFASFSMPDTSLNALIEQSELAGAAVILRGLVNDSVEDTMLAVRKIYGEERQEAGALIDPTLFERFDVNQVPSVVVTAWPAPTCSDDNCATPDFVKISGDVPLRYSLERIAASRPDFPHQLEKSVRALSPGRQW